MSTAADTVSTAEDTRFLESAKSILLVLVESLVSQMRQSIFFTFKGTTYFSFIYLYMTNMFIPRSPIVEKLVSHPQIFLHQLKLTFSAMVLMQYIMYQTDQNHKE